MRLTILPAAALTIAISTADAQSPAPCDVDNGGLALPAGFCAKLVGQELGPVRHLAIAPNGDVIAAQSGRRDGGGGGLLLLRDTDGDGMLNIVSLLSEMGGTGVVLAEDAIYFSPNDRVLRIPFRAGDDRPSGPAEIIVSELPTGGHAAKTVALGSGEDLYVNFGSLTNSCQEQNRQANSPGHAPCTELETRAGIWRFDARRIGQTPRDGVRHATGLRNAAAIAIEPTTGVLWGAVHGRDQLAQNWGYAAEDSEENPAEEFGPLAAGADFGWPYCYFDPRQGKKVLNPEYGGNGSEVGDCDTLTEPAIGFPAHWAPIATAFYTGSQFPPEYRSGAFISFHGSWNRAPSPQAGFRIVFAPFENGVATGTYETFAAPAGAHDSIRFTGVAVGPDGSLYVGADREGKIWRISARKGGGS